MGTCFTKSGSRGRKGSLPPRPVSHFQRIYTPRSKSSVLLCYDLTDGKLRESIVTGIPEFQEGLLTATLGDGHLLCVGGVAELPSCFVIDLDRKEGANRSPPPQSIAYGQIHVRLSSAYVMGALDVSDDTQEKLCPPLHYDIHRDRWKALPEPPVPLALYGSVLVKDGLYTFGGFLDHPALNEPCKHIFFLHLSRETWVKMDVSSPLQTALPMCTLLEDDTILILGGYDPLDRIPESREVFLYTAPSFKALERLPAIGKLHFNEPPIIDSSILHIVSEDETLFKYDILMNKWSYLDMANSQATTRQSLIHSDDRRGVYRLQRESCSFLEYSPKTSLFLTLTPTAYRLFPKHSGILLTAAGKLIIAGGTKHIAQEREVDTDQVWLFDPVTRITEDQPQLQNAQSCLRLVQVQMDVFAMCGVSGSSNGTISYCQVLKESALGWEMLPQMPYVTKCPGVAHFRGDIYCLAGESETEYGSEWNLIQVYHLASSKWDVLRTEYPVGVHHIGLASLESGILCFGGLFSNDSPNSSVYLFDGQSFSTRPNLQVAGKRTAKFQDTSAIIDGKMYIFAKAGVLHAYDLTGNYWTQLSL